MPNWVMNSITVSGQNADKVIEKLLTTSGRGEIKGFNFNELIPMPESLKMISGSITQELMNLYLNSIKSDSEKFEKYKKLISKSKFSYYSELSEDAMQKVIDNYISYKDEDDKFLFKTKEDVIAYGKQYFDNIEKYGCESWYDWSVHNWGTKWNACDTLYSEDKPEYVMFQTAWSPVPEIMIALSKKFPKNTFYYEFSEEQIGYFCGFATYKNGKEIESCTLNEYTKEAHDLSNKVWNDALSFVFNERENKYDYIESDEDYEDAEM